jgi:uncharacterized protein YpmB
MVATKKGSQSQKKAKASAKKKASASARKKVAMAKKPATEYFGSQAKYPSNLGLNDKSKNRGADRMRSTGSNSRGR